MQDPHVRAEARPVEVNDQAHMSRLDRRIHISRPGWSALVGNLRERLGNELDAADLSVAALAGAGSTCADVVLPDLMAEIGGDEDRPAEELRVAAIHESGHALAYVELAPGTLQAISLRDNGGTGGLASASLRKAYISAIDVRHQIIATLAGRAAEEIILNAPPSACGGGATSDLAVATCLAVTAATAFGLDEPSGLVWSGVPDTSILARMLRDSPALAARVRSVIDEAYQEALILIRHRSAAVEAIAAALLIKRALDGDDVATIAARHPAGKLS